MYERTLIKYLPPVIRGIREYKAIMNEAEQPEIVVGWDAVESALSDQFIADATDHGISRWEKILGIIPQKTLTLEERRFTVLSRINEQLPYTFRTLDMSLKSLCGEGGYSVYLNADEYTLIVKVALTAKKSYEDVKKLLEKSVPANMVIKVSLIYNTNEVLHNFKHKDLTKYTHRQLRNEVLVDVE